MTTHDNYIPAHSIRMPDIKDKKVRKWVLEILRAQIKTINSLMAHIMEINNILLMLRDFYEKLELAISEEEEEL